MDAALALAVRFRHKQNDTSDHRFWMRGRSSGVEHNLAKVGVVSSNLIARSILILSDKDTRVLRDRAKQILGV